MSEITDINLFCLTFLFIYANRTLLRRHYPYLQQLPSPEKSDESMSFGRILPWTKKH